jgi:hypothetical protein
MPTLPSPFQHSPGIPIRAIKQEVEVQGIQIAKEFKLSLFADDMILKEPKSSTTKQLDTINRFSNVQQ